MKYRIGFKFDTGKTYVTDMDDSAPLWSVKDNFRALILSMFNVEWNIKQNGRVIELLVKIDKDIWKWKNGKWVKKQ